MILALIEGKEKFTDPEYVAVFKELASWAPYMGNGFQAQKYPDSQNLFSLGKAAIYPAGSWGPDAADELLARDGRAWRRL